MKTGFNNIIETEDDKDLEALISKLMTYAIKSATFYAQSSGRDNLSGMDMIYGLQYEAHQFMYRPVQDDNISDIESDQSENSDYDTDDDIFTPSEDVNEQIKLMNHYHDTWDTWIPDNEIEELLKRSVDLCISKYADDITSSV